MTGNTAQETTFAARRLTVPVPSVREFQKRYERAAPFLPEDEVAALVDRRASWSEMVALIEAIAPHGFLIYWRNDVHPVMGDAGDAADCVAYLMGNQTIAERMFRHDPRAMLYAPLRTVIWEDDSRAAWFTVDQPSTQFESFGIAESSAVGVELDHKLAALLHVLEVEVPESLQRPRGSADTDALNGEGEVDGPGR